MIIRSIKRHLQENFTRRERIFMLLFPIIATILVQVFVGEPFWVPTGSLQPTVMAGDVVLVNKIAAKRAIFPERGDVVAFKFPKDQRQIYMKRVVGLPGDHVRYNGRNLTINGKPVTVEVIGQAQDSDEDNQKHWQVEEAREQLGNHVHAVWLNPLAERHGVFDIDVPEGHYFVMGDNRDRSVDSRAWGVVARQAMVGKAWRVVFSMSPQTKQLRWQRFGKEVV